MKKFFTATMMTAVMFAAGGAARADEIITEARTVDGRPVKVVLDGVVDLKLKQGAPALVLSGDKRYLQKITVTQNGDTIRIGTENMRGIHVGPRNLKAELTLPQLRELVSAGVGSAEVKGFDGDEVRLSLEGAGAVNMASRFKKVDARLTGVGSMTVSDTQADVVDLNLKGAGQIAISGQSKQLYAKLGGIGSLDAKAAAKRKRGCRHDRPWQRHLQRKDFRQPAPERHGFGNGIWQACQSSVHRTRPGQCVLELTPTFPYQLVSSFTVLAAR